MNNSNQHGNQTDVAILKDVALFDFIIGGSTGEKTVEADDFIREVGKMLPKGAFSWVSKYRNEAKREILKVGVSRKVNKRVRGYFVPVAYAQDLSKKLLEIKAKYLVEKETMLQQLPKLIEEWADSPANKVTSKPGGESRADLIRRHAPKKDDLERGLSFDISAIQINATSYFGADDALQAEVVGLVGQAAMEIAEDVKRSWTGATSGKLPLGYSASYVAFKRRQKRWGLFPVNSRTWPKCVSGFLMRFSLVKALRVWSFSRLVPC